MKFMLRCFLLVVLAATGNANAQTATDTPPAPNSYKIGGMPIVIPPPTTDLVEAGDQIRSFMEVAVPINNRLIAAFLLSSDLSRITNGGDNSSLSKYALVEVPRGGEYTDIEDSDFKQLADSTLQQLGNTINSSFADSEDEFNRRLKDLNVNATVSLGKPVQIGRLFSKQDTFGFGMISQVTTNGTSVNMTVAAAVVRVKKRLVFAYFYAVYKDDDTVKWLRKASEDWADAILKANQQAPPTTPAP